MVTQMKFKGHFNNFLSAIIAVTGGEPLLYIKPCPVCGRNPKITECVRVGKKQERRRFVGCPNYCNVIVSDNPRWSRWLKDSWFEYYGDGDDNTLYKIWNDRVS